MKNLFLLLVASVLFQQVFSQFDYYATAIYLAKNGTGSFYNNSSPGNEQNIGTAFFQGANLGSFVQNSGDLSVVGAEVKTFKSETGNVCGSTLFFTVYPAGERPASPVYTSIGLGFYSNCTDPACGTFPNSFPLEKGGGCCNPRDQKWQYPGGGNGGGGNGNIDLTNRAPGNYTLEVYYQVTGETNGQSCNESKYDNNASAPANYTASFTITVVLAVRFGNITAAGKAGKNEIGFTAYAEANSEAFAVERAPDGVHFSGIGKVLPAPGNSSGLVPYHFSDNQPLKGANYYRVSMREKDGKKFYSGIAVATSQSKTAAAIYPNPASGKLQVDCGESGNLVRIINSSGALAYQALSQSQFHVADISALVPGRYQVLVVNSSGTTSLPLLVVK